jgi:hypothetical protein
MQSDSARHVQVFVSLNPTALLRQHLGAGQQEALAIVDTASRWNSIGRVEQLLFRSPAPGLKIRAEQGYCVVSGTSAQMAAAESKLKSLMKEQTTTGLA